MKVTAMNLLVRSYVAIISLSPMVQVGAWKPPPHTEKYSVCQTPECMKRGAYYLANMDNTASPCKNFYRFACGHWSLNHPRPKYASQWAVDDVLNVRALSNLRCLLDQPIKAEESEAEIKAKKLYHMCISRNEISKGDMQFVTKYITSVGEYTRQNLLWYAHDEFLILTGESAFFSISYKSDSNNTPILQFKEIDSPYGSIYHIAEWKPNEEKIYTSFLSGLLEVLMSLNVSPKKATEDGNLLRKVIEFRQELNAIAKKCSDDSTIAKTATVAELLKWYNKVAYTSASTQINWLSIVRILYPRLSPNDMRTKALVTLRRKEYFIALALLLSKTPPHVLVTHMQLYFMERHLDYDEDTRRKLDSMFSRTRYIGRIREDVPRWMVCLQEHGMELRLGKIYVKNFFPPIDQPYMQRIIEDMRDVLKEDVKKSWLSDDTKKLTTNTLTNLKSAIGFPNWNMHPDDKISIAETLPMKPDAFYDPNENRLYLAAAALTSPMYEPGLPLSVNIAGIGSIIGHELHHMFGDCGAHTLEDSDKSKLWWPKKDREKCETKKQCFVEEYNLYAKKDLLGLVDPSQIDSRRTFEEDVADVMGLNLAYRYHKQKKENVPQACQVLPGFEAFTCDQVFFIAYANTMCAEITSDYLTMNYAKESHNPRNLRINGALRNHKTFNEVFGCRPNSPMNPPKKCNLWD